MTRITLNPELVPDLGEQGYQTTMSVYEIINRAELEVKLSKSDCSLAQAQAALAGDFLICFSSNPDGTGMCQDLPMHAVDAEKFAVGMKSIFHYERHQVPGYGILVAITSEQ